MFTSQQIRAVLPTGQIAVREQRLDDVVHQIEVSGGVSAENVGEVARRIDAALGAGVRWLIFDVGGATEVADPMLAALVATARELRTRRGELIVAGSSPDVALRLGAYDVSVRPALASNVDQAIMILKMLRPKTRVDGVGAGTRARQRITSMTLPRIEPRPLS
jgi:anti-anti-sigma regulatory factor